MAVTASVEAVAPGIHAGRSGDRARAAELGEGGFGPDSLGVVAEDGEHRGSGIGSDAEAFPQPGSGRGGDFVEEPVVRGDFFRQREPALGEASARNVCLADETVQSTEALRRKRAQRSMRALSANGSRSSRSSAGALTTICFNVMMALVRALTAVSRATLIWRSISAFPWAHLATARAWPLRTERAATSASRVSDFPFARRARRSPRLTSITGYPALEGQQRSTATFRRADGRTLHVRKATRAEPPQQTIYDALGIDAAPGGTRKNIVLHTPGYAVVAPLARSEPRK